MATKKKKAAKPKDKKVVAKKKGVNTLDETLPPGDKPKPPKPPGGGQ